MKRIFVLGGILEARQLCERLSGSFAVTLSVATAYGAALAEGSGFRVLCGKQDAAGFAALFESEQTDLAVDCSHPFAEAASRELLTTLSDTLVSNLDTSSLHPRQGARY